MFEQIFASLGKQFVVPAVFLLIGAWSFNKLSTLHDSKRRSRIEFLEMWHDVDTMSDMRLEVITRHFVGSYLPAEVIRTINRMPFPTQTLFDLEEIWTLVRFDQSSQTLSWNDPKLDDSKYVLLRRVWALLGYLAVAPAAVFTFGLILRTEPSRWLSWISALNMIGLMVIAWSCLARFHTLAQVDKYGTSLLSRINAALPREDLLTN